MADLFGYINAIQKKEYQEDLSGYSAWMINRFMVADASYVPVIAEINSTYNLTDRMHFDLLYYAFPKTNKFLRYNMKKEKSEKEMKYLMQYYNIDLQRAKTYAQLISKEEFDSIIEYFENRGANKKTSTKGKKK